MSNTKQATKDICYKTCEINNEFSNHLCQVINDRYKACNTRITMRPIEVTPHSVKYVNSENEVYTTYTRHPNGMWDFNGRVIHENTTLLRNITLTFVNGVPTLLNQQCLDVDETKRNVVLDESMLEFIPVLYHSPVGGWLWMKLNDLDPEKDVRKVYNPIFFDLQWKSMDPKQERLYDEFRFPNLREYFNHYQISDSRLRHNLQTGVSTPKEFINLTTIISTLLKKGVDANHVYNHYSTLVKLTKYSDFVTNKLQTIVEFIPFHSLMAQIGEASNLDRIVNQAQDLDSLKQKLVKLNPRIKIPTVQKIEELHDTLSEMVCIEEARLEAKPFKFYANEVKAVESIEVEGFKLKQARDKAELRHWGRMQEHCIGTYENETTRRLISVWKDNEIISCMEIYFKWEKDKNNKLKAVDAARVQQHRGRKNYDPKIPDKVKAELEKRVCDFYSKKKEKALISK